MLIQLTTGKKNTNVQQHVSPYGRIDGTAQGITAEKVSQTETGKPKALDKLFISVPNGGGDVKVVNLNGNTTTVNFQAGVNPVVVKEVVQDASNPTEIDIYY